MTNELNCQFNVNPVSLKKLPLPNQSRWRVSREDKIISGELLTLIKRKGLFFNHSSKIVARAVTLTRHGFLIIYNSDEQGYVINLPDAVKIKSSTNLNAVNGMKRTCIKIKLASGSIIMAICGEEANEWIKTILRLSAGEEMPSLISKATGTEPTEIDETPSSEEELLSPFPPEGKEEKVSPQSSDTTSTTVDAASVRQGDLSVATLRQILEAKMDNLKQEFKKSPTTTKTPVNKSTEEKKTAVKIKETKVKKNFFRRIMGKSKSAPAVL